MSPALDDPSIAAPRSDRLPGIRSLAMLGAATGAGAALLRWWGLPFGETAALVLATAVSIAAPGWVLTAGLGTLISPAERVVTAGVVGLVTTPLVQCLWNSHLAGRAGLPGTNTVVFAWCAVASCVAIGSVLPATRPVEAYGRTPGTTLGWPLFLLALAPIPALFPFADPNGRLDATGISFDMDEFTHFNLVGSMLRAGTPTVSTLAGFPMPPYQFLVPALTSSFMRLVDVDPIHLQCRWLPIVTLALASTSAFIAARRILGRRLAAIVAALALCYAGDPATTWGLVSQTHSAVAYATFAIAVFLLGAALSDEPLDATARETARRPHWLALALAGWLIASLFQSKAPLFFTAAGALGLLTLQRWWTLRDTRPIVALLTLLLATAILGSDRWTSVTSSPLRLAPGANVAAVLAMLPPPWGALGRSRVVGFAAGVVLVVLGVGNFRLAGLPAAVRSLRRRSAPSAPVVFLLAATGLGLVAANVVYEPDNPGGLAPLWFVQHPLLLASQLAAGWAFASWLDRRAPHRRRAILATVGATAVALTLSGTELLGVGDEPQRFESAERDCGDWIRTHSAADARVLHVPERTGLPIFSLRASVLALEPILRGDKPNGIASPEYMRALRREVAERRDAVERFFSSHDPDEARSTASEVRASFLFLGRGDPLGVDPESTFGSPVFTCGDGGRVFRLSDPAAGP